jgi:SOS-response transcriptional repressor LexA
MAPVIPIRQSPRMRGCQATWSLLEVARPGARPVAWGILLVDDADDTLTLRLREATSVSEWSDPPAEEQESDVLTFLGDDLRARAREIGGKALLGWLEDSVSHFIRISDRTAIAYTGSPASTADRLFDEHVDGAVRPFITHLPVYTLRAAATRFGEGLHSEQEGWRRVPEELAREGRFVARVVGRSMEPLIPDGSLCVFETGVTGSRHGKRLLIEQFGETDFASRYTVKRYTSRKKRPDAAEAGDEDAGWEHERIRLEPLNREFAAFELSPDEFRVVAEFVAVLDF